MIYSKQMRDRALSERKGLVCIEVQFPSKDGKKFGHRITYQGPSTVDECQQTMDFFLKLANERNATPAPSTGGNAERKA